MVAVIANASSGVMMITMVGRNLNLLLLRTEKSVGSECSAAFLLFLLCHVRQPRQQFHKNNNTSKLINNSTTKYNLVIQRPVEVFLSVSELQPDC